MLRIFFQHFAMNSCRPVFTPIKVHFENEIIQGGGRGGGGGGCLVAPQLDKQLAS